MASFTIIGGLIAKCLLFGLPLTFGILFFLNLKSTPKKIIYGILFTITLWNLLNKIEELNQDESKFVHRYRLPRLYRKDCTNCYIDVLPDHTYNIIKDNLIIGDGEWKIEHESEIGTPYIVFDNDNSGMMRYYSDTIITHFSNPDKASAHHRK